MSDALEKLQHELETAQHALAEAEARYARQEAEYQTAIKESENTSKQIKQAHQEWISALDAVEDPIFVHDKDFRVLRCNLAYQRSAGIPLEQIIGRPYYEVFPKIHTPLHNCLQAVEKEEAEEVQVGNTAYRSRAYIIMDGQGNYLYSVHTLENINESRRINKALRDSELRYRRLFEAAKDGILILSAETGMIVDANPFILDLLSLSLGECTGKKLWEIGLFKDIKASKEAFKKLQSTGYIRYEDLPLKTSDGRRIDVEFISNVYEVGNQKVIQCNIRNITETLRTKELLMASRNLLKNIVENTPIRVFWKDTESRYLGCNTAFAQDAGWTRPEDLIGKDDYQMAWREWAELYRTDDKQVINSGIPKLGYEEHLTIPDGSVIWIRTSKVPLRAADGMVFALLGIYEDITERKQAEKQLQLFRTLLDNSSDGIEVIDPTTLRFLDVNDTECRELGFSREEMLSMCITDIDRELSPKLKDELQNKLRKSRSIQFETMYWRKDGSTYPVECSLKMIELDKLYALNIVRDITERRASEQSLRHANRALKTLSAGNMALVQATQEDGLLQAITEVIVKQGGYAQAVVNYAENDPEKSMNPKAWSGFEGKAYWAAHSSWADTEQGQLPASKAIRSGKTQVCRDVINDLAFNPWREKVATCGYVANIALPMSDGKNIFGSLSIYSSDADTFDDEEILLLEELANDLSYGIVNLRTRKQHEQQAMILRQSLEQSIETIADTVEARDPYTAGHQRRVSELAIAIAREMRLPDEQINGIHFAAIIHDLGKIHIPAEILAKPGKLTDIELNTH